MSFPKELNLGSNRPMAAAGKPSINRYRADNSSYQGGDIIRIEIPCGRNGQYLFPMDSMIEARIKANYTCVASTGATTNANSELFFDQSVYSLFNRMRIIHGSTVIEDTLYTNRLWTCLYDVQISETERRGDTITKLVNDNTSSFGGLPLADQLYNNHLTGTTFKNTNTAGTADTQLYDFAFVLPSGVLGSLCSKAIPLGSMGASSIYLELELAPANIAFVSFNGLGTGTGPVQGSIVVNSYTIQDIYYNAKIATLPDDVNRLIVESTGGYINIPAVSYKTELKSIGSTSSAFNDKFSFQFSSIKTFLFWFTSTTSATGDFTKRSISSRPKCYLTDYFLLINGEAYPSQSIGYGSAAVANTSGNSARMYAETQRAFNYLTDCNAGGILTYYNYSVDDPTAATEVIGSGALVANDPAATTIQKRFVAAIDLDRFNRSSDVLMCGTSSIGQMVNINMGFSQAIGTAVNLYASVMYDVLYHVENGQMLAKF